jgi:hypothetical protein
MFLSTPKSRNYLSRTSKLSDYLICSYINIWILLLLVLANPKMYHWFILPTLICGTLIGVDAIKWIRGDFDLFDPKGILGVVCWHSFFLAPLLFIFWDVGMRYVVNPTDWRIWVGFLSILNIFAILLYRLLHKIGFDFFEHTDNNFWYSSGNKILPLISAFLVFSLAVQFYYFYYIGGINGIINITSFRKLTGVSLVSGVGLYEIIGNSFPILFVIMLSLFKKSGGLHQSPKTIVIFLLGFLSVVQFVFGGLRGSRSSLIWPMFWIVGVIHYFWRPFSRRSVFVVWVLLISFMYLYGFYKGNSKVNGLEALLKITEGSSFSQLETETGRSFKEMVVADFARVDTQSFELFRLSVSSDYELRWGKTYITSILSYIPGWLWPDRPLDPEKIVAGTELFYGRGAYVPGNKFQNSQKVYGLGGEALLNFGVWSFPLPFAIWGFCLGRYRRSMVGWAAGDFRWFFAPFITLLFIISFIGDLYNVLGFVITKGLLPSFFLLLTIFISVKKTTTQNPCG